MTASDGVSPLPKGVWGGAGSAPSKSATDEYQWRTSVAAAFKQSLLATWSAVRALCSLSVSQSHSSLIVSIVTHSQHNLPHLSYMTHSL